ncbi:MAG TPA: sugar phosphate isomerase/epimerase [Fimbriimonas sp.]|nr:sugar phosphate isomerase/epimerase [Fimbriimonas sp.]
MSLVGLLAFTVVANPRPMPFMMSVQAWTFNRFSTFEAIEKAKQAGSSYIEMFPGQLMKQGGADRVGPDMSEAARQELAAHLAKTGVKAVAFGVTDVPQDQAAARKLFAWAKSLGIGIINTESTGSIDTIEVMVKEFDMKVGYHNHPKRDNDPNYKVWDPAYIYELVKNRDKRIGACADTGHWVRSKIKPIDALNTLKGRVVSSHLKDLHEFGPGGHDMPYGLGVSDVPAILAHYDKIKMSGSVSVEYEYNWDANVTDVAQCMGYVHGLYGK